MSGGANWRETAVESTAVLIRMVRLVHNHLGSSLRAAAVAGRAAGRSEFCHQDADNVDQEESVRQHRQRTGPDTIHVERLSSIQQLLTKNILSPPSHSESVKPASME